MFTPDQETYLAKLADQGLAEEQAAADRETAIEQAQQDAIAQQEQLTEAAAKAQAAVGDGFVVDVTPAPDNAAPSS